MLSLVPLPERWVEWRCWRCRYHICNYNVYEPCHLKKDCPRCKELNELNRRQALRDSA